MVDLSLAIRLLFAPKKIQTWNPIIWFVISTVVLRSCIPIWLCIVWTEYLLRKPNIKFHKYWLYSNFKFCKVFDHKFYFFLNNDKKTNRLIIRVNPEWSLISTAKLETSCQLSVAWIWHNLSFNFGFEHEFTPDIHNVQYETKVLWNRTLPFPFSLIDNYIK